jgi:hypothetical protein
LNYTTTWFGNSFGGESWVQNFVQGMSVGADGSVYVASEWDEAGREFGVYKDGAATVRIADTHGWGTGGGRAVVADDKYIYIAHSHGNEGGNLKGEQYPPKGMTWYGVSRRWKDGPNAGKAAPFEGGKGRFKDMLVLHESAEPRHVLGLAARGGRLYLSDTPGNAVRVIDREEMKPQASWPLENPRQMAFDGNGLLWVSTGKSLRALEDGGVTARVVEFPTGITPNSFAFDNRNRLLVADGGASQQVLVYDLTGAQPRFALAFGERGGMFPPVKPRGRVDAKRGRAEPKRFLNPVGVGVDTAGNLYVGFDQSAGGAVVRSFAPDGKGGWDKLRWEVLGLEFVDSADADPRSDGTDVWTTENRYTLDWSQPTGKQWTWRSQTVDPVRFPLDPRLHEGHHNIAGALFRRINGRSFLVVRGMFQNAIVFYRIESEIAVPSAMIARGPYRDGGWKEVEQPDGRWIWRDNNGDGAPQKDEFISDAPGEPEYWAQWVDSDGGVWQGWQPGTEKPVKYLPLQGLDLQGNPIHDRAKEQSWPLPSGMTHLLRLEYLPATDTLYLAGHTAERPKTGGEWGQVGSEVWRIDGWMRGNRTPRYRAVLPYLPETGASAPGVSVPNATIKSLAVEGDHFFAVESRTAIVHVYDAGTGRKVGTMSPGPEVGKESGWVDFPDAIRATRRKDGEYLVFVEEDAKAKIITYRWKP